MVALKGQTKFRYFVSKERSKVVSRGRQRGEVEGLRAKFHVNAFIVSAD